MKKYVVLSVNDNVDYLYFTPLTCWAWEQFGWTPIVFFQVPDTKQGEVFNLVTSHMTSPIANGHKVFPIDPYRSDTITQISRLYGSCVIQDGYLMTSDIDMIPLSDYWKPDENKFTVWGHDLTGFKNFPLCYIGGPARLWQGVMKIDSDDYNGHIKRDLDNLPQARSQDFYSYWETDQDHITERLKQFGTGNINFINRGQGKHGFAKGRVDKGHGGWTLDQPELIDAHLLQQAHHSEEKIKKLMDLLHTAWPKEDWKWFLQYTKEFKKLAV